MLKKKVFPFDNVKFEIMQFLKVASCMSESPLVRCHYRYDSVPYYFNRTGCESLSVF